MQRAKDAACRILLNLNDPQYAEDIRRYQGCPTVALTHGGRVYLGWYAGGTTEPHIENYNWLVYSDDGGKTLSAPLLVIPSDRERTGAKEILLTVFDENDVISGTIPTPWVISKP
ncbi:MAG: hypothetical protein IJW29_05645 [Clostridia bacterium]|nr:hypothetical protein [Clostridia bacterium]